MFSHFGARHRVLVLCLFLASALHAQLAYEPFNYSTGSLTGLTGGTGFSGGWSNASGSYSVVSGSLSVNSLTSTGLSASGTGDYTRTLTAPVGDANQNVWFSAVLKITNATNSGNDFAGLYFGGGSNALFMGASDNGAQIGIVTKSNASLSNGLDGSTAVNYNLNTSYLLVLRLDFGAGLYYFYVNPTSSASPGTPTHGETGKAFGSVGATDVFGIYSGGMTMTVDEVRLGSTYASVVPGLTAVPEPATWAVIAGVGAVVLAGWRKRRRTLGSAA